MDNEVLCLLKGHYSISSCIDDSSRRVWTMVTSSDRKIDLQGISNDFLHGFSVVRIHACLLGCWPHEPSYLHDNRSSDNVVHGTIVEWFLDIKVKVLLVGADGPDQLGDVVGVQTAGLCRQTAGQVCVADMGHSLKNKKVLWYYTKLNPWVTFWYGCECVCKICALTLCTESSPGTVVSMFPPASAAKSTTTDPSFMLSTIGLVIRMGARLPTMIQCKHRHQGLYLLKEVKRSLQLLWVRGHTMYKNHWHQQSNGTNVKLL